MIWLEQNDKNELEERFDNNECDYYSKYFCSFVCPDCCGLDWADIWYDIDVTWDDCLSSKEYFLVPAGTRVFADRPIDCCDMFYY